VSPTVARGIYPFDCVTNEPRVCGLVLLLLPLPPPDFAEDEAQIAEIDERVAETYKMVQQSVEGKIAEGYPPTTNASAPPPKH
jgi:hypothetical protein